MSLDQDNKNNFVENPNRGRGRIFVENPNRGRGRICIDSHGELFQTL